jgi:hypothetical protein
MQQKCDPLSPESSRAALKLQTSELDAGLRALVHLLARQVARDAVQAQEYEPDQAETPSANQDPTRIK